MMNFVQYVWLNKKIESETVDVMTFVMPSLSHNWQRCDSKFKLKDVYNTLRKQLNLSESESESESVSIHINLNVAGHLSNAFFAQGGSWTHSSAARLF